MRWSKNTLVPVAKIANFMFKEQVLAKLEEWDKKLDAKDKNEEVDAEMIRKV